MAAQFDRFNGTDKYIVSPALRDVVNVSISLGRPLLVKGEPGTGKTLLAHNIARGLNKEFIIWNVKSTTKAKDGLYVYDTVQRLNDSRFGTGDVKDIKRYIHLGQLGRSFVAPTRVVLLIDEIDKADLEFPNDLLNELDEMSFFIPETEETIEADKRPIVIITSNSEKELPDAFLRRCVFHYIEFPEQDLMKDIIHVHFPNLEKKLLKEVLGRFYWLREIEGFRKKPSTSELLDWIAALIAGGISPEKVAKELPFAGALIKKEQDMDVLQAAMERSGRGGVGLRNRF
jgi:MoxR-like ATPase